MKSRSENSSEVDGGGSKNSASEVSDTTVSAPGYYMAICELTRPSATKRGPPSIQQGVFLQRLRASF